MMKDLVFAQAVLLVGELDSRQAELLKVLCGAAASSLAARLRAGVSAEDCREDFITAASLYALADLSLVDDSAVVQEFKAGDLTVKKGGTMGESVSRCLQRQAEMLMAPYLQDSFAFLGV